MFFVLGFLCSGPDQVIFQRHKKNETERAAKGEGGGQGGDGDGDARHQEIQRD